MACSDVPAVSAAAVEFRSADVHNSEDYPTVDAAEHMTDLLDKRLFK